jgi:hypothetical protein
MTPPERASIKDRTCASCEKFPLAGFETGTATCAIFERLVEHSDKACVLHDLARDHVQRKAAVVRLVEQKTV